VSSQVDETAGEATVDEVERLLLLVEASGKLLGSPTLDAVLPAVLDVAGRILAADAYALWLRDTASDVWRLELAAGLSPEYQATATASVAQSPRTVALTDTFEVEDVQRPDWVTAPHREAYARERIRSLLALPLRVRDDVVGTLVFYYREPHRFQDSERRVGAALGGVAASAIATAQLVEGQSRTAEERRFVVEASELLSSSLDYETTLRRVAQLAVPRYADWCAVDLVEDDGAVRRLAVAHVDPAKVRLASELAERFPEAADAPRGAGAVIRSGASQLTPEISDDLLVAATADRPGLLEVTRDLGLRSVMIVPLTARGRTFGALTFVSAESGRRYAEADLALAESLARNAALAVDNARLLRRAERDAAELDALLTTAPVGIAFWDRELRYVRVNDALAEHHGKPVEEHLGRTVEEVLDGLGEIVPPILLEVLETGLPLLERQISWGGRHWLASYYPVSGDGGETLGVGAVINEVTLRRRLEDQLEFLAEASAGLASSLDYETTLENVAALAVPRLADSCAIDLFEEDAIRRVACTGPGAVALEGPATVRRTGEPLLVQDESGSVIVVPLPSRGRVLGALTLAICESGRVYDEVDLSFAEHVGRRTATAVDNALLYRQAQEAFRTAEDSSALLEALLGTAPIGLFFLDAELRYVRVNEALAKMNGVPVEGHLGRRPDEAVPELGRHSVSYLRRVLETGEPETEIELEWDAPGLGRRYRLGSYYPVRRPDGEILGVGGVSLDITERKRGERALLFMAEASELLASTLDVEETLGRIAGLVVPALAGQCIVDLLEDDGSLRCVAVAHLDPDREELLRAVRLRYPPLAPGHPVQTVLASGEPQLLPELSDEVVAAMAHSEEHREQIRALGNTSGIVVPLRARGRILGAITLGTLAPQPLFRAEDVVVAAELGRRAAVAVDNARLYRAAEERAQAALALAYVGDGVALVDSGGVVRLWNRAAEQLTGIPADGLVGRLAADAVPGWSGVIDQVLVEAGPGARAVTLPVDFEGRELWLSISAAGYPDGTVYAFRDLTEERVLERMRTDFVSTVSHELRTPLAAIYGGALTLRRADLALPDDQRDGLLDVIASESDRLARIVNDILWASRVDAQTLHVTLARCDVGALATEVVNAARLHLPPRIELGLDLPSEPALANCDSDKLRQVLTNLVDNAIKYSPDGGRVDVGVSAGGDRVRIAVRDEGLGIPPAEQSRIFEKFYRLDPGMTRGVGGTGLGLYICRELVRIMDGAIWVVSREQGGSTFTVELRAA
jgi:PAS domain S-box-containing protein